MTAIGIGFIPLPSSAAEHTRQGARAALNDVADTEGVALRLIYEPPGISPDQTRASMTTLQDVATMHEARTLLIFGAATEEILDLTRSAELRLISVPDPTRRRPAPAPPPTRGEPRWMGQVNVALLNGRGWLVRTIRLDVQAASIIAADGDQVLAQLDRQQFREWLSNPAEPLQAGAVIWCVQDGTMCVDIEGSVPYIVSTETIDHLSEVI